MMKYFIFLVMASFAIISCSPKASLQKFPNANFDPYDEDLGFAVLAKTDTVEKSAVKVGLITAGDGGMTVGCDYASMITLITDEAVANGANLVKIMEHKTPDYWSTCHRIKAFAYRVDDISKYENWIKWTKGRKIARKNFKASTENRPLDYRTVSRMMYSWKNAAGRSVKFKTWAEFSCLQSYISEKMINDSLGLHIQHLIFDNTEVHRRLVLKEIDEAGYYDYNKIVEQLNPITDRIVKELDERADLMIVDISKDRNKYQIWRAKIDKELTELDAYYDKSIVFRY